MVLDVLVDMKQSDFFQVFNGFNIVRDCGKLKNDNKNSSSGIHSLCITGN